jgi:hypothetical protein
LELGHFWNPFQGSRVPVAHVVSHEAEGKKRRDQRKLTTDDFAYYQEPEI